MHNGEGPDSKTLLPAPHLDAADRDRLRSLRSRTALVRSELRGALRDLEHVVDDLQPSADEGSNDDDVRRVVTAASSDVRGYVDELASEVRRFEAQLAERPARLVAAFFGRTMAGKSTLVETLIGGDGEAIGRGGQRTTRETRRCPWGDIDLYDTPGIGALHGAADAELARRDVRDADLVIFVLTDDSIQAEHVRGLEHVKAENKPVLFLLNSKLAVDNQALRKRFLADPDAFLGDAALRGHLERLNELAGDQLGLGAYSVLGVQAQAAWLGVTEGDVELLAASGLGHVVEAVTSLVAARAVNLRIRSTYDPSILQLERTAAQLTDVRDELRRQSRIYFSRAETMRRELDQLCRTHRARAQRTTASHLSSRRAELHTWVNEHIADKDFRNRLEQWLALDVLEEELQRDVEDALQALGAICIGVLGQLVDDLDIRSGIELQQEGFQFTDWRKAIVTLRRVLQVGGVLLNLVRLTKWGKRFSGAGGPAGWVVLVGTEVLARLAKRFPGYNPARRAYVQQVTAHLERTISALEREASAVAAQYIQDAVTVGAPHQIAEELIGSGDQLAHHAGALNDAVVNLRTRATRLSASMCGDLLGGPSPALWCRLPGQLTAVRGTLEAGASTSLGQALGEVVLELPGTAPAALREAAPGWSIAQTRDSLELSGSGDAPLEVQTRKLMERIAERPVVLTTGNAQSNGRDGP